MEFAKSEAFCNLLVRSVCTALQTKGHNELKFLYVGPGGFACATHGGVFNV